MYIEFANEFKCILTRKLHSQNKIRFTVHITSIDLCIIIDYISFANIIDIFIFFYFRYSGQSPINM